jgi:hypothetical protein
MKTNVSISTLSAVALAALTASAQQPPPVQINAPYRCENNMVIVIKHCEMRGGTEMCSLVKGPANGPLGDEISMPKAQAAAIGLICQPPSGGASQTGARGPATNAKVLNPPYLSGMPSTDLVKREIQGKDATDTLARQVAVFNMLPEVITRFMLADGKRYNLTPDEAQVSGQYTRAAYDLEQGYKTAHTPAEAQAFAQLHGRYELDSALDREMHVKLFSPAFLQQLGYADKTRNQAYQAHLDQEKQVNEQAKAQANAGANGSPFVRNDAGTVAARRCVESGRSEMECMGEGLKVGLNDLAGGDFLGGITGEKAAKGLRLSGSYSTAAGKSIHLSFSQDKVFTGCGRLDPVGFPYEVTRTASQILVKIPIAPQPLVVAFRPDNTISGPSDVAVSGLVVKGGGGSGGAAAPGYQAQTHTETRERQIDAAEASNYAGTDAVHQNGMEYSVTEQVNSTTYEPTPVANYRLPPMESKTERCTVGVMQGKSSYGTMTQALTQLVNPSVKKGPEVPPGLRLAGTYAGSSGLRIEFREDLATVECGEAHVAEPYVLQDAGGQISVKVQNGATPFLLSLQPNGTLVGSGSIDVAGRVVTGSTQNALTYASRNARCTIGTLALN